ncbi:MAG: polyphosphate polymerase domain-containing protein [Erysipelotrichaceae bacterium]
MTTVIINKQVLSVPRHEIKHVLHPMDAALLTARCQQVFASDPHAGVDGVYDVHSLYFDTPNDQSLQNKHNGLSQGEKFRLRYYNQASDEIRLEKKSKRNGYCMKRSSKLTYQQVLWLLEGKVGFLLESGDALQIEFYHKIITQCLTPKTIVSYTRQAFVYAPGNVRVTIDRDIKTTHSVGDFFSPQVSFGIDPGVCVLEIKYDEFLPDIVAMTTQVKNIQASAYSKYAMSRVWE